MPISISTPSQRALLSLAMTLLLAGNTASAWIVADASVTASTTGMPVDPKDDDFSLGRMYNKPVTTTQRLPFLFQDWDKTVQFPIPFRNIFAPLMPPSLPPTPKEEASWSHSIQGESIPCTYMPVWDWQLDYFAKHLTNFQEIPMPDPSLAQVQTTGNQKPATRVRTKWFASDEYRLIRMTYMDGGDNTQIFTTVCYPRTTALPIMGHGLLQVGDRRITISDFQPFDATHEAIAQEHLKPIQEQYPSLNQEMSERFFQQGEFWSDCTLLGRFSKSEEDQMWKDLWPAYQQCVSTHVGLCQQQEASSEVPVSSDLLDQHKAYDAHVASRDPAIRMLTGIFGQELATKVVYEALFPLAEPPSQQ